MRKIFRRGLPVILSMFMVLQCFAGNLPMLKHYNIVNAQDTSTSPTLRISDGSAGPGETATVTISIENNPGLTGIYSVIKHDESLEFGGIVDKRLFQQLIKNTSVGFVDICPIQNNGTNVSTDGDICTIDFVIPGDAQIGTVYAINWESINSVKNQDNTISPDDFVTVNGSVTVTKSQQTTARDENQLAVKVNTKNIAAITASSAIFSGEVAFSGASEEIKDRGFIYYEKMYPNAKYNITTNDTFTVQASNLKSDTEYIYQAYAENSYGVKGYGRPMFFTTSQSKNQKPTAISLNNTYVTIAVNNQRTLLATILPKSAVNRNISWSSSNTSVAKVSSSGVVTAIKEGTAVITAKTQANNISAQCVINVTDNMLYAEFDFSEHNMITNVSNLDPVIGVDTDPNAGGNDIMATAYLSRWDGAVLEKNDKYPESGELKDVVYRERDADYHVQDVIFIPKRKSKTDNNEIKYMLMKYGAVSANIKVNDSCWDSNICKSYYVPDSITNFEGGHAITIVGWDDNYSKSNFSYTPNGDGAFICKNSWGSNTGENGYFYVSYYDKCISENGMAVYNNLESNTNYNKIYQYDDMGVVASQEYNQNQIFEANVFPQSGETLAQDEELCAASFYTYDKGYSYEVYVVKDYHKANDLRYLGSPVAAGTMQYAGYHTVDFDNPVKLAADTRFAVVVKLSCSGSTINIYLEAPVEGYSSKARANADESYVGTDIFSWKDETVENENTNVCVKAFTRTAENTNQLFKGIDNENRQYTSNKVYKLDELCANGAVISDDFKDYIELNGSSGDLGYIPDSVDVGSNNISYTDGMIFPTNYDLRKENMLTSVKNQKKIGGCWTFSAYASLESCLRVKGSEIDSTNMSIDNNDDISVLNTIINSPEVKAQSIDSNPSELTMGVGDTKALSVNVNPVSAKADDITWVSGDETIAKIDTSGNITALSEGTAYISARSTSTNLATIFTVEVVSYLRGDCDNDGKVTAVDAALTLRYFTMKMGGKNSGLNDTAVLAADVDKNGVVDAVDAAYILKYFTVSMKRAVIWEEIC